eukprot:COSAG04_NODE_1664_length_6014_cov_7.936422_7_plen_233_part_00
MVGQNTVDACSARSGGASGAGAGWGGAAHESGGGDGLGDGGERVGGMCRGRATRLAVREPKPLPPDVSHQQQQPRDGEQAAGSDGRGWGASHLLPEHLAAARHGHGERGDGVRREVALDALRYLRKRRGGGLLAAAAAAAARRALHGGWGGGQQVGTEAAEPASGGAAGCHGRGDVRRGLCGGLRARAPPPAPPGPRLGPRLTRPAQCDRSTGRRQLRGVRRMYVTQVRTPG